MTLKLQPWLRKQPITFNLNKRWAIFFFFRTRYCQSLSLRTAAHIKTDNWLTDLIRRGKLRISEFPRDLSATSQKPGQDLNSSAAGSAGWGWADSGEPPRGSHEIPAIKDNIGNLGSVPSENEWVQILWRLVAGGACSSSGDSSTSANVVEIKRGSGIMPHIPCR